MTPEKVEQTIDAIMEAYDRQGTGVLYKRDAKRFLDEVIKPMPSSVSYKDVEFDDWFSQYDNDYSGAIERHELVRFIMKVALTQ